MGEKLWPISAATRSASDMKGVQVREVDNLELFLYYQQNSWTEIA